MDKNKRNGILYQNESVRILIFDNEDNRVTKMSVYPSEKANVYTLNAVIHVLCEETK